jgi:hypothetical protein
VTQTHISSQNIPEDDVNKDESEEMFVQECQNILLQCEFNFPHFGSLTRLANPLDKELSTLIPLILKHS